MIILIGGEKGGTGKTTIAVNLAVYATLKNKKVLVVDTDKQQSACGWGLIRKEMGAPNIDFIEERGQIQNKVKAASRQYDHVIIDAGGRDSVELRAAMVVADAFYTPVRASQFDLVTLDRIHNIVIKAREINTQLRGYVVVNCGSTHPKVNDTRDAVEYVSLFPNLIVSAVIRERAAFKKIGYSGLGVQEFPNKDYDKNAVKELSLLAQEVYRE